VIFYVFSNAFGPMSARGAQRQDFLHWRSIPPSTTSARHLAIFITTAVLAGGSSVIRASVSRLSVFDL
jgi:hypothetical protein